MFELLTNMFLNSGLPFHLIASGLLLLILDLDI